MDKKVRNRAMKVMDVVVSEPKVKVNDPEAMKHHIDRIVDTYYLSDDVRDRAYKLAEEATFR